MQNWLSNHSLMGNSQRPMCSHNTRKDMRHKKQWGRTKKEAWLDFFPSILASSLFHKLLLELEMKLPLSLGSDLTVPPVGYTTCLLMSVYSDAGLLNSAKKHGQEESKRGKLEARVKMTTRMEPNKGKRQRDWQREATTEEETTQVAVSRWNCKKLNTVMA